MGTEFQFGKTEKFWGWMVMMAANTPNTTELYTQKWLRRKKKMVKMVILCYEYLTTIFLKRLQET